MWGIACPVLGGAPRPGHTENCGTCVCSDSGLPDDPSWGRLGYIRWLDTAQALCHSEVMHPLDHTDFTGYWPSVAGCHRRRPCRCWRDDLGWVAVCYGVGKAGIVSHVVSVSPPCAVVTVMSEYGRYAGPRFSQLNDDYMV